ncbi:hypothetical protein [Zoogloea sp.]|uniref:hypothetical protein n=1 Tax=Zoogloea sp. TaxID=49181 RepID=UPI001ACE2ED8|nr:hypothetical protein [Zoogloea sp.]MBN8284739.1 hypothetical protein [Zoogloea sp.]
MAANAPKYMPLGLALLFAMCAALELFLMFKAGCAGDPKGGSLGNPARALDLESVGLLTLLLSAASGGAAIGLALRSIHRIAQGVAFALLVFIGLWFAGAQFEVWGVQSCFKP